MIHMGTLDNQIVDGENATTNVLYQCKDFGSRTPDPSKPTKRYYKPAAYLRRRFDSDWLKTSETNYTPNTTYINWEIVGAELGRLVGQVMVTYYFQFRHANPGNISPD